MINNYFDGTGLLLFSKFHYVYICLVSYVVFKRLLTYLHILQQDNYNSKRFLVWFFQNRAYDRYMTSVIFICILLNWMFGVDLDYFLSKSVTLAIVFFLALIEKSPLADAKKLLVLTHRATRILITSCVIFIPFIFIQDDHLFTLILTIQSIPFALVIGNMLTLPFESIIQKKYIQQAKNTLNNVNPIIIGITGSFGKTSMKHILGHILQKYQPTLFTPGSVNTPMGICSIIQKKLSPDHKFFIVEMGAYHIGSIAKICSLTPPNFGAVTSIGPCHLERFGSMENIASAKSELLSAVEQNKHPIGFSFPTSISKLTPFETFFNSKLMMPTIECIEKKQTVHGIELKIKENEQQIAIKAPIFGLHQADNIVLAITVARKLGTPMELIKSALLSLKQVPARLEVKDAPQNITWINDGFNANPEGFKEGINLLKQFGDHKHGRKILVTPGVIELGDQHDEIHAQLAKHAMSNVDVVIVVAHHRIKTFLQTCELLQKNDQIIIKALSFSDAHRWLNGHVKTNDTILIANDLPDILETRPNI